MSLCLYIAVVMYSNAKPVVVTNAAAYTSLVVTESLYDPNRLYSNITINDSQESGYQAP